MNAHAVDDYAGFVCYFNAYPVWISRRQIDRFIEYVPSHKLHKHKHERTGGRQQVFAAGGRAKGEDGERHVLIPLRLYTWRSSWSIVRWMVSLCWPTVHIHNTHNTGYIGTTHPDILLYSPNRTWLSDTVRFSHVAQLR